MSTSTRAQPRQPQAAAQVAPSAQPEPQSQSAPEAATEKKQPVFTWSHPTSSGRVEIAVWDKEIQGENGGRVVYSVTCQRSYRKQDGGYENTGTFWHTDLLVLAHGLEVVFDRIKQLQEHVEAF